MHSAVLNRWLVVAAFLSLETALQEIRVTQQAFLATGSATDRRSRVVLANSIWGPLRELVEKLSKSHPWVLIQNLGQLFVLICSLDGNAS